MKIEQFVNKLRNAYPVNVNQENVDNIKLFMNEQNLKEIDMELLWHEISYNYNPIKNSAFPPLPVIIDFWKKIDNKSSIKKQSGGKYENAAQELENFIESTKSLSIEKIIINCRNIRNLDRNKLDTKCIEFLYFWDDIFHENSIMDDLEYNNKLRLARLEFIKEKIIKNEYYVPLRYENKNAKKLNIQKKIT